MCVSSVVEVTAFHSFGVLSSGHAASGNLYSIASCDVVYEFNTDSTNTVSYYCCCYSCCHECLEANVSRHYCCYHCYHCYCCRLKRGQPGYGSNST
jgi:hypothetical protein